jgi:hypothetical protein
MTNITFRVINYEINGLLFYLPPGLSGDFLAIGVIDQTLQLRYNLGTGLAIIANPWFVQAGGIPPTRALVVSAVRQGSEATLIVDGHVVSGSSPGTAVGLNLPPDTKLYVGGIPLNSGDLSEYEMILNGDFKMGAYGCLADIVVNGVAIDLISDAVEGSNVGDCDHIYFYDKYYYTPTAY